MHLIGLNGFKRSGKNATGDILAAIYGDGEANVKCVGFADKLKIAAARALGFDRPEADLIALMDSFKETGSLAGRYNEPGEQGSRAHDLTGRQYLQWFGTEAGRQTFSDTFWIDLVLPNVAAVEGWGADSIERSRFAVEAMYPGVDLLVVTDVRFENEARRIRDCGGVIWEVLRPGITGGSHASEQPLDPSFVDYTISNDGDLKALEAKVERALDTL